MITRLTVFIVLMSMFAVFIVACNDGPATSADRLAGMWFGTLPSEKSSEEFVFIFQPEEGINGGRLVMLIKKGGLMATSYRYPADQTSKIVMFGRTSSIALVDDVAILHNEHSWPFMLMKLPDGAIADRIPELLNHHADLANRLMTVTDLAEVGEEAREKIHKQQEEVQSEIDETIPWESLTTAAERAFEQALPRLTEIIRKQKVNQQS